MFSLKIIDTEDGSKSIFVPELNETYHSIHGAITEAKHVFIKNGFRYSLSEKNPLSLNILEVGMGTGLNILLTMIDNLKFMISVNYTAIEAYPAPGEILSQLNYAELIGGTGTSAMLDAIHSCTWNENHEIAEKFGLKKLHIKFGDFVSPRGLFDLVYYHAFAPSKQPEMWELPILGKVESLMKPSGVFVTFAAKGQLKRDLKSLGLHVDTLPGPPGKKEMIRAIKPAPAG